MSWKISSKDKYVIMASAGLLQFLTGQSVFDIIALVREYDYIFSLFVSLSFVLIINGFRSFIAFINKTFFFLLKKIYLYWISCEGCLRYHYYLKQIEYDTDTMFFPFSRQFIYIYSCTLPLHFLILTYATIFIYIVFLSYYFFL